MNNGKKSNECNGPMQMSDVSVIDNWKDSNNGYLKSGPVEETVGPLLGNSPVTTVVQVSGSGARTMVLPGRNKASREKCLLIMVLVLILISGSTFLLLLSSNRECSDDQDKTFSYIWPTSYIKKIFNFTLVPDDTAECRKENLQRSSNNEVALPEGKKFVWHHNSTLLFLEEYKRNIEKFRNPKIKKKTLWENISTFMNSNGYATDPDALDRKLRNMKNTYRTILDNNNKKKSTGKGRIQWEYFSIFEDIFQEDKTVNAAPIMFSSTRSIARTSNELQITSEDSLSDSIEPCCSGTSSIGEIRPTIREKRAKATQLDTYRKRQLEIEEEKLVELKKLRESVEESNQIQEKKLILLQQIIDMSKQ